MGLILSDTLRTSPSVQLQKMRSVGIPVGITLGPFVPPKIVGLKGAGHLGSPHECHPSPHVFGATMKPSTTTAAVWDRDGQKHGWGPCFPGAA